VFTLISIPLSQVNLAHLVVLDLTWCGNLTCLWENDANIQVKELFLCNGLVTHKINPHLFMTFCTLYASLNNLENIDSRLLYITAVPYLQITHAKLP
jgi:hypothetical protein